MTSCVEPRSSHPGRSGTVLAESSALPRCVADVVRHCGTPLAPALRHDMERCFGADFSRVAVHTDPAAAESARMVQARAYTVGSDVVFGAGQFAPAGGSGRELLVHELAHVVQQRDEASRMPDRASERSADQVARDVVSGRPISPPSATAVGLARAPLSAQASEPDDPTALLTLKPVDSGKPAADMTWTELRDAIDEHERFIAAQISTTPEVIRRKRRTVELQAAQQRLAATVVSGGRRAARARTSTAQPARPRSLGHSIDLGHESPAAIKAELDRVVAYLAAGPSAKDRALLEAELPFLEQAAETARAEAIAARRRETLNIALTPTSGDQAGQLTEMLRRVEHAERDVSSEGTWLIHYDGQVLPVDAVELQALRQQVALGLVRGASAVNNFIADVAQAWEERYRHNKRQWIVHGLVKFATGAEDISPKKIQQMVEVGNFYVRRIRELGTAGQLVRAGDDLLVFDGYARYWSEKVGDWESTLVGGAGRWVIALTVLKESLSILAGFGAAKLASGGSILTTLKTGAKVAALTTGTGAVAGGVSAAAAGRDWTEGARAGGGAGFGVGANALTAGVGRIAPVSDALKATTRARKAYAVGKAVALEAGANVTTSVTQAAIEGGDKGRAAIAAFASSPISTLGGGVVDKVAKGRAAVTAGRTIVGSAAGATGALASDANVLAGALIGGGGGLYGGLASPLPGTAGGDPPSATTEPPALTPTTPAVTGDPVGGAPRTPSHVDDATPVDDADILEVTPIVSSESAPRREVGESAVLGDDDVDAFRVYRRWQADDPSREVALIYNHAVRKWAVVQGTPNTADTIAAARALGWDPAQTTVSGRHSHPPGSSGVTPPENLYPSGRRRDLDMIRSDASKSETGTQWSAIDVTTAYGPDAIHVFYDRKSNVFTVRSPDPAAGPRQYEWHSFPNVEYFHAWYRNRFGHDPSPVTFGPATESPIAESPIGGAPTAAPPLRTSTGDIIDTGGEVSRAETTDTRYSVDERFGDPHPHVPHETESRYHVRVDLADGVMSADFMLRRMDIPGSEGEFRRSTLRGRDEFMAAIDHFQSRDPNAIKEIRGDWGQGDNLDAFNVAYSEALRSGLGPETASAQAARRTTTGQWAGDAGFTEVRIVSIQFGPRGLVTHVEARFSRP